MNIVISGGTGFIGRHLVNKLVDEGHHIYVLTRYPREHADTEAVSYISYHYPIRRLPFIHAVINLAGESLFGYWTEEKKENIIASRLQATEALIQMMMKMEKKPDVFITGSAIGYYGMTTNKVFTEDTTEPADDFLAQVVHTWEITAQMAEDLGIRTIYTRFGVVLDKNEGALPLMALPIQLFVGGQIGNGEQWISWIHIEDCVNLLYYLLTESKEQGPVNITAPYPQRNKEFVKTLAKTLNRPALLHTPRPLFQLALGEMHQLITKGQYVLPQKALKSKFTFRYPRLDEALKHIFHDEKPFNSY